MTNITISFPFNFFYNAITPTITLPTESLNNKTEHRAYGNLIQRPSRSSARLISPTKFANVNEIFVGLI